MKKFIKIKIKQLLRWVLSNELNLLKSKIIDAEAQVSYQRNKSEEIKRDHKKLMNILDNIDVSVDVHHYSRSWACISIQGKTDYIKFVDLGEKQIREIAMFISRFDRQKVDASPSESKFIKMESRNFKGF